jgi:hypothetical protein
MGVPQKQSGRADTGGRRHGPENTRKTGYYTFGCPLGARSMEPLLLRAAITRGVLLVIANWPVVLIDFVVGSFYRVALAFPVVGGALMVTVVAEIDVRSVLAHGIGAAADIVVGSLSTAPAALAAFFGAVALVALGGQIVLFIVKAGTLSVLVHADRAAGEVHRHPLVMGSFARANVFRLETLVVAGRRFARRGIVLALWLGGAYALVATVYLMLVTLSLFGVASDWVPAWSAVMLVATSGAVVVIVLANLAYTLLRVVIVTDDCDINVAVRRLGRFVIEDARQVIGIFSVIACLELLAAAISLFAAAGLAPVAYLPLAGLMLVPVEMGAWLVRALLFETLSLSAVAAYQTQYRRFSETRWPPIVSGPPETAEV